MTHERDHQTKRVRQSRRHNPDSRKDFGKAFSPLLYHISFLRLMATNEPIYLTKVAFKSAYRRIHLQPNTAVKLCTCIDWLLLIALRLTFGGSANSSLWSEGSEVITDLANDLVRRTDWDPKRHHSPHQHLLFSERAIDGDADMIPARDSIRRAYIFASDHDVDDAPPRFDCYLDDNFEAFYGEHGENSAAAVPLAIHTAGQPHHSADAESFPQGGMLALSKFLAEAKTSQRKMILGLTFDTRAFAVMLPRDKLEKLDAIDRQDAEQGKGSSTS